MLHRARFTGRISPYEFHHTRVTSLTCESIRKFERVRSDAVQTTLSSLPFFLSPRFFRLHKVPKNSRTFRNALKINATHANTCTRLPYVRTIHVRRKFQRRRKEIEREKKREKKRKRLIAFVIAPEIRGKRCFAETAHGALCVPV